MSAKFAGDLLELRRKRGIQAIKAAQAQLGLDDDVYRTMLEAQTGKRSASLLNLTEQARVLDYLRSQGATNPAEAKRQATRDGGRKRGTPTLDKVALLAKVNALLTELGRVTGTPHTLNYADAICKRNGWAERIDFCSAAGLHSLVGALSRTLRAKLKPAAPQPSKPPRPTT
ncbi:regulatory protein GemA [Paucibacter sp. TC2R-5]|uniref:regulatory protein GemA n=1 Tax=Paucibacter sp. TC2R-5 TaxID=2893555 RepID=UPI0021E45F0E|nr:regulatory protein GemA [Paucibacter sp. TC2R-5]MCV2359658.1 regulatory protein GemA [Paucibacter sp. TC2R-5]